MTEESLFGLAGRVAAIIGAGSGIGEAVALGGAEQGATGCCLDVDLQAASATAEAILKQHSPASPFLHL